MKKHLQKTFILQQGFSDCGVACLLSATQYYGGENTLENLRELSGTTPQGTTLLGLYQAAQQIGFEAQGGEADVEFLKSNPTPSSSPIGKGTNIEDVKNSPPNRGGAGGGVALLILHVLIDNRLNHYVVFYGYENGKFIIGDPAKGIVELTENELLQIWQSKKLLQLKPNQDFVLAANLKAEKRRWFYDLVEPDSGILIVSVVLGVIIAILGMTSAVFFQQLIDKILPTQNTQRLFLGIGLLALLLLARNILSNIRGFFMLKQSKEFNNRLINNFYGALLYLPKSFFDSRKIGELIARMNDTQRIQNTISYLVGSILVDILSVLVAIIFLFFYQNVISLLVLIVIPSYIALAWYFSAKLTTAQKNVMASYAHNESNYIDTIQGIDVIKTANKETFFAKQTQQIYDNFQTKLFDLGNLRLRFNLIAENISLVLLLAVLSFGGYLVLSKELELGGFVAIFSILGLIVPAINRLVLAHISVQEAKVAFDRMFEFITLSKKNSTLTNPVSIQDTNLVALTVQNLNFRFAGRKPLLKNISFEVKKGEILALIGESGKGKSTLLQILQKFYRAESGEIKVYFTSPQPSPKEREKDGLLTPSLSGRAGEGLNFENISIEIWRNLIAVVPQQPKIFNATLLFNICLDNSQESYEKVVLFCRKYGFDTYFEAFPQHYLTLVGEEGQNLSGGQQQLVVFARALYQNPQLLLLDEVTSSMDSQMAAFVLNILQNLKKEMAIVMISHTEKHLEIADNQVKIM